MFSFESSLYIEFKMISSGNKIMNYNLTILFELLSTRFSLVVHLFLQVGRRPLFPMFIEPRPTLFRLKFPSISLHSMKREGRTFTKCGKKHFKTCASQPILGDFNFQRAFEIPWCSNPINVKGFTTVQGFLCHPLILKVISWHDSWKSYSH